MRAYSTEGFVELLEASEDWLVDFALGGAEGLQGPEGFAELLVEKADGVTEMILDRTEDFLALVGHLLAELGEDAVAFDNSDGDAGECGERGDRAGDIDDGDMGQRGGNGGGAAGDRDSGGEAHPCGQRRRTCGSSAPRWRRRTCAR